MRRPDYGSIVMVIIGVLLGLVASWFLITLMFMSVWPDTAW